MGVESHHAVRRVDEAAEVLALVGVAGDDHRAHVAVRGLLRDDRAGASEDAVHLSLAKGVLPLDDHDGRTREHREHAGEAQEGAAKRAARAVRDARVFLPTHGGSRQKRRLLVGRRHPRPRPSHCCARHDRRARPMPVSRV